MRFAAALALLLLVGLSQVSGGFVNQGREISKLQRPCDCIFFLRNGFSPAPRIGIHKTHLVLAFVAGNI